MQPKINDKEKVIEYVKRLIKMYLIYNLIYLPKIIYSYIGQNVGFITVILQYIRKLLFIGYSQFWYFVGLIVAVLLLYFLTKYLQLSDKTNITICIVLYIIGVFGCLFPYEEGANIIYKLYNLVFETTRNGIFYGLPYVYVGYYIRKKAEFIKNKNYLVIFLTFFGFMGLEAVIESQIIESNILHDLTFLLMPTAIFMFLTVAFIKCSDNLKNIAIHCRKLSVLIFGLHLIVPFYANIILIKLFDIWLSEINYFGFMLIVTMIACEIILYLSNKKALSWLKILY